MVPLLLPRHQQVQPLDLLAGPGRIEQPTASSLNYSTPGTVSVSRGTRIAE
jgi:hypothetical protein